MTLSDIKFKYEDKISNLDTRIKRYQDIIEHYNERIKKAKEKGIEDYSSLTSSKEKYELKIRSMYGVRTYYKEFVDTSDYLMQFINEKEIHLVIKEKEELQDKLDKLQKEYDYLVNSVEEHSDKIAILNGKIGSLSSHNLYLQSKNDYLKKKEREVDQIAETIADLKYERDNLKQSLDFATHKNKNLLKINKNLNKKLNQSKNGKDMHYERTIKQLEARNKHLENYCNDLLNRKNPINWHENIFEQIGGEL